MSISNGPHDGQPQARTVRSTLTMLTSSEPSEDTLLILGANAFAGIPDPKLYPLVGLDLAAEFNGVGFIGLLSSVSQ